MDGPDKHTYIVGVESSEEKRKLVKEKLPVAFLYGTFPIVDSVDELQCEKTAP